ncbi:MAG: hypothetical protein ACK5Z2_08865 [Bacteroidota bacterium]|jgi:hypothetical protein
MSHTVTKQHIHGSVPFQSNLSITEVGDLISKKVFPDMSFGGLEENIYDEVPAIYIKDNPLGLLIVLQGYQGTTEGLGYSLNITPNFNPTSVVGVSFINSIDVDISDYLYCLLKSYFGTNPDFIFDK